MAADASGAFCHLVHKADAALQTSAASCDSQCAVREVRASQQCPPWNYSIPSNGALKG